MKTRLAAPGAPGPQTAANQTLLGPLPATSTSQTARPERLAPPTAVQLSKDPLRGRMKSPVVVAANTTLASLGSIAMRKIPWPAKFLPSSVQTGAFPPLGEDLMPTPK